MSIVSVEVRLPNPYQVLVGSGLLPEAGRIAAEACPAAGYALITDSNVEDLYAEQVGEALGRQAPVKIFSFPANEKHKTRDTWITLSDQMLGANLGRDTAVVALGGGVVGDLAGFVAATYLRGVRYIQIPTTLLAMIDSSVGGKTGVDTAHGKNLIGAFHQPEVVISDIDVLRSLPDHHFRAGTAEALKHGAIRDRDYFDALVSLQSRIASLETDSLIQLVARSVRIKSEIVAADEREGGERALLNFGHTLGHAIEAASRFQLLHGEAVAIGMVSAASVGEHLGITLPGTSESIRAAVASYGLPDRIPRELSAASILDHVKRDKKRRSADPRFVLLRRIGEAARDSGGDWTTPVDPELLVELIGSLRD